jgi:hypothetical protein
VMRGGVRIKVADVVCDQCGNICELGRKVYSGSCEVSETGYSYRLCCGSRN